MSAGDEVRPSGYCHPLPTLFSSVRLISEILPPGRKLDSLRGEQLDSFSYTQLQLSVAG